MTFGKDGGNGFMTGRIGLGVGAGISYNPNGTIPGSIISNPSQGGVIFSDSAKANFNFGPGTAYLESGISRNYSDGQSTTYGSKGYSFRDRSFGIDATASIGAQCTIYSGRP